MAHSISTDIEIDATPERVWEVLTDIESWSEWNPFITSSTGSVAVGERLANRMEPPGKKAMTFKPTVTVAEDGRTFEWLGHLLVPGLFDGRHRFELSPVDGGRTRLVHGEEFSGVLARPILRSIRESTIEGFTAMNEALKDRVEAAT